MKSRTMTLSIVILLVVAAMRPARAQDSTRKGEVWLSVVFGFGTARLACDTCRPNSHLNGLDLLLGAGGTPNPHLRFGVVWQFMQKGAANFAGGADTTAFLMNLSVSCDFYPSRHGGFFSEVGFGLSDYRVVKNPGEWWFIPKGEATPVAGTGLGGSVGLGYQFSAKTGLTIAPRLTEAFGLSHDLHSPNGVTIARRWTQNVMAFGVEFGLHGPTSKSPEP
jgi:hypothetical protein